MGEGGKDHDGIGDEVCKVDPIVTKHISEKLREWWRQARREERSEEHYLTRPRLRHAGAAALPQHQHVRPQVLHVLERVASHPRLRKARHLCAWEKNRSSGYAVEELGDEERR